MPRTNALPSAAGPPDPTRPGREWPSLLVTAAALAVVGWPAWKAPTRLAVGGDWTEGPGHLWGLWVTASGLAGHGPFWRSAPGIGWPDGLEGHLIDPTSLLLFLPGFVLAGGGAAGATLGWNVLHVGATAIGCLGAWALARFLVPGATPADAGARAVAVATVAFSSFWLAQPWLGRSEYLGLLLMPGQLALLLRAVRPGGRGPLVGAGLLLGAVWLEQGYIGLFAAMVDGAVGLGLLVASRDRRATLIRLALVAAMASLVALPAWLALAADPDLDNKLAIADWPVLDDVLCVLVHTCTAEGLDHRIDSPLALGLVPSALALAGLVAAPRRVGPWLLLAAVLVVLGLGTRWHGRVLPAGALASALPILGVVKSWARLGSVTVVPLCAAAALGVHAVSRRLPGALGAAPALVALPLIALEGLAFPRTTFPGQRPAFEIALPEGVAEVLEALPDGPIITLPPELPLQPEASLRPGFVALWQQSHQRPISGTLDGRVDVLLERSLLVQAATLASSVSAARALSQAPKHCLQADVGRLSADGWVGVLLVGADQDAAATVLAEALGPPAAEVGEARSWRLVEDFQALEPCPPRDLHTPRRTRRKRAHP